MTDPASVQILKTSPMTGPAFAVHLVLAVLADHAGTVEVSLEDLSLASRVSQKTVQRALLLLQEAGLVTVERRGGGNRAASVYNLPVDSLTTGDRTILPENVPPVDSLTTGQPPVDSLTTGDHIYIDPIYSTTDTIKGGPGGENRPVDSLTTGDQELDQGLSKTERLIAYFAQVTGRQAPPTYKKSTWLDKWILPSNELLGLCQDDVDQAYKLVYQTLAYMSERGLVVATPASLVNVAAARPWEKTEHKNGNGNGQAWVWDRDVSAEWTAYAQDHDIEAENLAQLVKWGIDTDAASSELPPWIE